MSTASDTVSPVIGISAYSQTAHWGSWDQPAVLLPRRYTDMVVQAGGLPVLLPPMDGVAGLLPRLDGLILSGGGDLDPALYGAERDPACGPSNPVRDNAELELCRHALAIGLPVLGVCRGLQVINVALGGTLHQHLPDLVGNDSHSPVENGYGQHEVRVEPGSRLAAALHRTDLTDHLPVVVPTHHHQAVQRLGRGLTATAWTADGVIEAVELDHGEHPFALAVQWHPEAARDLSLFTALAAAAAGKSTARAQQPSPEAVTA